MWLRPYNNHTVEVPDAYQYTIGNPLVAQTMLKFDYITGLYVPPRLFVIGNTEGSGSRVIYDLPSSLITAGGAGGEHAEELKKAAEALDAKLEGLATAVTSP